MYQVKLEFTMTIKITLNFESSYFHPSTAGIREGLPYIPVGFKL